VTGNTKYRALRIECRRPTHN